MVRGSIDGETVICCPLESEVWELKNHIGWDTNKYTYKLQTYNWVELPNWVIKKVSSSDLSTLFFCDGTSIAKTRARPIEVLPCC